MLVSAAHALSRFEGVCCLSSLFHKNRKQPPVFGFPFRFNVQRGRIQETSKEGDPSPFLAFLVGLVERGIKENLLSLERVGLGLPGLAATPQGRNRCRSRRSTRRWRPWAATRRGTAGRVFWKRGAGFISAPCRCVFLLGDPHPPKKGEVVFLLVSLQTNTKRGTLKTGRTRLQAKQKQQKIRVRAFHAIGLRLQSLEANANLLQSLQRVSKTHAPPDFPETPRKSQPIPSQPSDIP